MSLQVCVTIERPIDEVWAYLEQIERHPEWMRDCVGIRFDGQQRRGVGTSYVADTRILFLRLDDAMEVVEWEPGRRVVIRHGGMVSGTGEFRLDPVGETATRFCWSENLRFPPWLAGRLGVAGARPVLRAIWTRSMGDLKRRLESA